MLNFYPHMNFYPHELLSTKVPIAAGMELHDSITILLLESNWMMRQLNLP